ncbi:hypothetical protein Dvina_15660 [Dactylosporangium vinaceum]|uniref:Uncharacterized protein n=1 Tax=Dactylosporangium vinaceum TaxID=53362 RepID=A0ABV5M215_9ACTN|nr:hypothetical protein [Dactylosporangium vinaceum]UAB99378.1 hypothetical protein Dvina_15660 [Dactylosporangium vinaceum]
MTNVLLHLPPEVVADAELPYEGLRDTNGITLALDGINVAASIVTLATLRLNARNLARAIRNWRLKSPPGRRMTLTVRGEGVELHLDLPPNVSVGDLLEQLQPLVNGNPGES